MSKRTKRVLPTKESEELITILKSRFRDNMHRHKGMDWKKVEERLLKSKEKLWSLNEMEETGGEPDVVGQDKKTGEFIFYDCSAETPKNRRSLCYDRDGLESRKEHRPENSAVDMAYEMGIELLTEEQYMELQKLGHFDLKTSSWLKTPEAVREQGGAITGDHRYGRTFIYHNGAQAYFGSRGFRGSLKI